MLTILDLVLIVGALITAWHCLFGSGLLKAVASFMVFGLLMALIWVRLEAPDIALAEAAIGAGVTGALLLTALGQLPDHERRLVAKPQRLFTWHLCWLLPSSTAAILAIGYIITTLPQPGMQAAIDAVTPLSGAEHGVTAVLLNLRAFDTLLEVAVMLAAVGVIWSLEKAIHPPAFQDSFPTLPILARLLHPLFLLIFAHLLWQGTHAPGGAFPAGAVLGSGGILLLLSGTIVWVHQPRYLDLLRWMLAVGLLLFLATALAGLVLTGDLYGLPAYLAGYFIIAIEVSTALSIALMLMTFYLFGKPGGKC